MIESVSPLRETSYNPGVQSAASAKVQEEFLTIFYKELLKQAFKAPDLGPADEEKKENDFMSSFRSDLMVEQLAQEMVKRGSLSPNWFKVNGQ